MTRLYVDRIDPDAADRCPLDHTSEARMRADDHYEPGPNIRMTNDDDTTLTQIVDNLRALQRRSA